MEKILSSLINYNYESSFKWKIQKDINYIQVLIDKELNDKAQKYLIRAKKNAYLYEEYELLLQIISLEISLCFNHCFILNYDYLKTLKEEREKINIIIDNLNNLLTIKAELQQFQFNENTYNFDDKKFIETYGHSAIMPENEVLSVKAKSVWLYINAIIYFIQNEFQKGYEIQMKQYELYKSNPIFFSRDEYFQLMNNLLYCCSLIKNVEMFNYIMNEFINIKNKTKEETIYITKGKYYRTLALFHQTGQYKEAEKLAIEAEDYFERNNLSIDRVQNILLCFTIARAYIDNNNFDAANRISQKRFKITRFEMNSSMFKLFEFIAHYKLNNFDSLIYSVDSWAKTIRSKRKQFPIEKVLIKFFRSVCNKNNITEKKNLITNTIIQLKKLENSEQKYYINHFFDFAAWFEKELVEIK
ncbi:MAG TPA: hypothetical protein PK762_14320 [Candidatus Kapabacteria bacterium]|nr:hypothetical protein [Candidatus Kapabacteria bacterium]